MEYGIWITYGERVVRSVSVLQDVSGAMRTDIIGKVAPGGTLGAS